MLAKRDKAIIALISQSIPLVREPFCELARQLKIDEARLLKRIDFYKKSGLLRKFCASLNHHRVGFNHNVMVVWNIARENMESSGQIVAGFSQVSHCYQRKRKKGWPYGLYSMIHGRSRQACLRGVREIAGKIGCQDYKTLFSAQEYKKTGAKYF